MLLDTLTNYVWVWTPLLVVVGTYYFLRPKRSPFPYVNLHENDISKRKAFKALHQNARSIVKEGIAKHNGPITIAIPYGEKIILPGSYAGWVKTQKHLDHKELVREDFLAGYPGCEAQTTLHAEDSVITNVIRNKLSQNPTIIPIINDSVSQSLRETWGSEKDWHVIDWNKDTTTIIARAASEVFIGPEGASSEEWLQLVQNYVMTYFSAVGELRAWHPWLRSIAQWFLPNISACRRMVPRARNMTNEILAKRHQEQQVAEKEGREPPLYNDVLAWSQAAGTNAEPGDVQLAIAMAAMFTTSDAFRGTLLQIAQNSEIVEHLREEIATQFSVHGATIPALVNMVLLDSVLKESQRIASATVGLERMALQDITLPNGQILPRGSHIMVDTTNLWDPVEYPNPDEFDAHRFARKRDAGDESSQFVQSSSKYYVFGGGRHICPGRILANNVLKLALAHVLLKYDIRLQDHCGPVIIPLGFYSMTNPTVSLQVRRREDDNVALDI